MTFDWSNKNILIAEDEPANYLFIEKIIKSTNANLIRAHNGQEAVEELERNENIDLVLMDIYMPEMDGFEATAAIRKIRPEVPIIAQTCYESQIEREKLEKTQFNDFVKKPININKLLVLVEKYMHGI